jgi:hypothetical protein
MTGTGIASGTANGPDPGGAIASKGRRMKKLGSKYLALATLVAGFAMSTGAQAYWNLGSSPDTQGSGVALNSIAGVYAANGGTFVNNSATNYGINGFASGAQWAAGTLVYYSGGGYGMSSDGSAVPNHAIDNGPQTTTTTNYLGQQVTSITGIGNTEAMLLNFSSSVALSGIDIGYKSGDADVSLFRFVGNAANPYASGPMPVVGTGASLAGMVAEGWELVGNYADLTADSSVPYNFNSVNSGAKGSSWWMISAYNTSYGGGTGLDQGNDYFKLLAVAGTKCTSTAPGVCGPGQTPPPPSPTPEPASLALVAVGLAGAYGARRRRSGAAAKAD